MSGPELPFVSVLIPALNEESYIADCLSSLAAQEPGGGFEILVLDGGSTDATRSIVERFAADAPVPVRLLENPGRLQAAAVNLGARAAAPEAAVLLRADAHAEYPRDYLVQCVRALVEHGATSVVVPMETVAAPGAGGEERAIAAAQRSLLGNGGSAHRTGGTSGWVDHGHHAAFDRAFFLRIGGYNESTPPNEDAEYDHRTGVNGGRVWMCREAPMTYFPRRDLPSLWRQYENFGRGRAKTSLLHGVRLKPRQLAPLAILAACAGGAALTPLTRRAAAVPLAYGLACCGWGATLAARTREPSMALAGPALMAMHLAWGVGYTRTAVALRDERAGRT